MTTRDLVKQSADVSGLGAFTLGAAAAGGWKTMNAGRTIGEKIDYSYRKGVEFESGTGTLTGANTLARTTVYASSNNDALVNFSAGTGEIIETVSGGSVNDFARISTGIEAAALPLASAPTSADFLTIIQGGTEKRIAIDTLKTYFAGAASTAPAATGVTLTGPTGGVNGVASSNFSLGVTPVGGTIPGTVRITPASTVPGDTFTPAFRDVTTAAPSGAFTLTPSSTGARTISATNNGGLANPATITYTATAAPTASYPHLVSLVLATESGTGPYTYTSTDVNTNYNNFSGGWLDKHFASGVDGEFVIKLTSDLGKCLFQLFGAMAGATLSNALFGLENPYGNSYGYGLQSPAGAVGTPTALDPFDGSKPKVASADSLKFKRTSSNGGGNTASLAVSVSKDDGATYTLLTTVTGFPTGDVYARWTSANGSAVQPVSTSGLI